MAPTSHVYRLCTWPLRYSSWLGGTWKKCMKSSVFQMYRTFPNRVVVMMSLNVFWLKMKKTAAAARHTVCWVFTLLLFFCWFWVLSDSSSCIDTWKWNVMWLLLCCLPFPLTDEYNYTRMWLVGYVVKVSWSFWWGCRDVVARGLLRPTNTPWSPGKLLRISQRTSSERPWQRWFWVGSCR